MQRSLYAMIALALLGSVAAAQEAVDPRIAVPLVRALQAQVVLQEAQIKAQAEDAEARQATLWQWLVEAKK
jgi:hypothetical protein